MKKILLLSVTILSFLNIINAQAGQLDPSFGNNGIVRTGFSALSSRVTTELRVLPKSDGTMYVVGTYETEAQESTTLIIHVFANGTIDSSYGNNSNSQVINIHATCGALQADGKIVIAGNGFTLARYNTDGTLDSTFSGDGRLTTDFGSDYSLTNAIVIQSDGKIVLAGVVASDFALARYNTDGTLDNTFSKDGKLTTDFASANDIANSVAIQADGKIIAAGSAFKLEGYQRDFAIARYNRDGTLDNSFSGDGKLTTDFASAEDIANSVAIQANGKIVVAGSASDSRGEIDFALVRYNADGAPDLTFSKDGKVITDFASGNDVANYAVIRSDGKIIVAGFASDIEGKRGFALARYNNDGILDTTFSEDGKQMSNFGYGGGTNSVAVQSDGKILAASGINVARYNTDGTLDTGFAKDGKLTVDISIYATTNTIYTSTAIQSDGKIVMAGYITTEITERGDEKFAFAIARYNTDGTLDSSFSGDGKQTTDFESFWQNTASAVAIQSDGKIVVAGSASNPWGGGDFAIARYNIDGTPDTSFSEDGKQTTNFGADDGAYSMAIQSDGKIVAAGGSSDTDNEFGDFAIARYNTDGTLDTAFSGDGKQTTDFASGFDGAGSVAIQKDGKIVAAGYTFPDGAPDQDTGPKTENLALARYNSDGTPDVSFSTDGKQTIDFASSTNWFAGFSMAIQSDGKIAAAGSAQSGSNFNWVLARCNTDGTLDTAFSGDGKQTIDFGSDNDIASSIAIQGDGKIIAAGYTGSYPVYNFALARFNNNGSLDSSFSEDGKQVTDAGEGYGFITDIKISNNKLYAAGYGGSYFSEVGIAARYLLDNTNTPPTVSLTTQANNAKYLAPANIKLSAAVADSDGTITKVEFYNGNKLLHTETIIPYGYTWRNVPSGNYTLTAKAYDNSGNFTTSAAVHVSVVANTPPAVSIISPANNRVFADTATIRLIAAAADTDGRITRVKFYNDSTLIRTEYKYPYTYNWQNVAAGTYTITAKATDNWGAQTTSAPVTITVKSTNAVVSRPYSETEKTASNDALRLRLSPNPATNVVNIYTSGLQQSKPVILSIISISGNVLKTMQISNAVTQLDVSSMVSGVYTIKIMSGEKVLYKQFVKL